MLIVRRNTLIFRMTKFIGLGLAACGLVGLLAACQPIHPVQATSTTPQLGDKSVVIDGAGPITASDPAQAKAEAEFRAVAIAKEQAYYDGDVDRVMSYYDDNVISVQPEIAEIDGKTALADSLKPYVAANHIVGKFTITRFWVNGDHATRQAQWEEIVTPKDGGTAEHHIGRCILNWEKVDGQWKVVTEFINYLVPPTEIK